MIYSIFFCIFQIHPWVNYESILQKCYLGRLSKLDPSDEIDTLFFNQVPNKTTDLPQRIKLTSPKKNVVVTSANSNAPDEDVNNLNKATTPLTTTPNKEFKEPVQLPRFDWIQKMDYITIIFYTKSFCNPQVEITRPDTENVLNVYLTYEHQTFTNEIKFNKNIEWPCHTKINYETGKIEIVFKKIDGQIWDNYGVLKQRNDDYKISESTYKYNVINKSQVNHNTCLLELQRADGNKVTVPLGKHVRVSAKIKGKLYLPCI